MPRAAWRASSAAGRQGHQHRVSVCLRGKSGQNAIVVLRSENTDQARQMLADNGVTLLSGEQVHTLYVHSQRKLPRMEPACGTPLRRRWIA